MDPSLPSPAILRKENFRCRVGELVRLTAGKVQAIAGPVVDTAGVPT